MSVQLVIAEKPSVARSIAAVIGADEKQNGGSNQVSSAASSCLWYGVTVGAAFSAPLRRKAANSSGFMFMLRTS